MNGCLYSQDYSQKKYFPVGTFHAHNVTINGISVGAFSEFAHEKKRFVKTNGLRLEIPGIGIFAPLGNGSHISWVDTISGKFSEQKYVYDEISNGINISGGTVGPIKYNGITLGAIAQFGIENNGLALAGIWNAMNRSNGAQFSILLNEAIYANGMQVSLSNVALIMNGIQIGASNYSQSVKGIQIGLFNKSKKTRGIQLGGWNCNEKRKLPILNWNFKS
jgi:hypothetical protein